MADTSPYASLSTPTRVECIAAADALDGAVHMVDDIEAAEVLARLADQWRAQASTAPAGADRDRIDRALAVLNGAPIPMGEVRARHAAAILRGDRG